jgi:hypothetical protein
VSAPALVAVAAACAAAGAWAAAPGREPLHGLSAQHPTAMLLVQFALLAAAMLWRRLAPSLLPLFWLASGLMLGPAVSHAVGEYGAAGAAGVLALSAALGLWLFAAVRGKATASGGADEIGRG